MVVQSSIINELKASKSRGVEYLRSQQRADGALGTPERDGLGPYYKALWAFAAAGESDAGNRLATWLVNNVQTPEGDFAGPMRGTMHDNNYAYPNAWLLAGAQKLGRFDLTSNGIPFLLALQDTSTGGFKMQPAREDSIQDVLNSAQAGNACLFAGHLDAAQRVAGFLRMMWDAQPAPEREFFIVYKPGAGLRTEFPENRQFLHSIRADKPRQPYFNLGMAPAFLVRLAQADGDAAHIELGKHYIELAFNVLDEMYETAQVGKVGWGAALLYGATGEERYRALAERVGEAMIAQQTDTGGWDNTGGFVNEAIRAEVTSEFVVLVDEMIAGLASR